MKKIKSYRRISARDVTGSEKQPSDLVAFAWRMLEASADASQAFDHSRYTVERLKQNKLTLGFVNATRNLMQSSMQFLKMETMPQQITAIKTHLKRQHRIHRKVN